MLRAPAAALGIIEGISDALAGAARLVGGAIADDPARRRAMDNFGAILGPLLALGLVAAVGIRWAIGRS